MPGKDKVEGAILHRFLHDLHFAHLSLHDLIAADIHDVIVENAPIIIIGDLITTYRLTHFLILIDIN